MIKSLLPDINDINIKIIKVILIKRLHVQDYERWRKFPKQRQKEKHASQFFFKVLELWQAAEVKRKA